MFKHVRAAADGNVRRLCAVVAPRRRLVVKLKLARPLRERLRTNPRNRLWQLGAHSEATQPRMSQLFGLARFPRRMDADVGDVVMVGVVCPVL